jgi:hypothetical protein
VSSLFCLFLFTISSEEYGEEGGPGGIVWKELVEMAQFLMFDISISVHPPHLPDCEELAFRRRQFQHPSPPARRTPVFSAVFAG